MDASVSSDLGTPGPPESRCGRKRLRNEENWKRKRRKLLKDSRKSYKSVKGVRKAAKEVMNITCRCSNNCRENVSDEERKRILTGFYGLGSHDQQNKYLFGLIHKVDVKRKRGKGGHAGRRHNFTYQIRLSNGKSVQVCKNTFCVLHGIGKRRVEGVATQLVGGVVIASDRRGKHRSRPHSIPDQVKERIREHIKLFPRRKSHYSRSSNRKREYLDEALSISRMYRLYLEKHEPEAGTNPQAKEWLYRKIFNEEFNLSFGYPRSDTCETCDLLNVTIKATISEEDREEIRKELADHQEKASQGYQLLRDDTKASKSTENHVLLTFDLMQNLPVPTLTHGAMFYSRQLWVYNFGIHNATTSTASMYMWNEAIAGRGADEICSCLKQYLETLSPQTNRLTCYSDSCFGQNKNFQMVCFWNEQVSTRFEQIDHKFLVRGHTYLPNDRDFAHIEKCKDGACVCVPADWEEIVQKACPIKPFDVVAMETSKFVDFTEQTKQYTQRKKDTERKPVLISKAVWMNFGQGRDITGEIMKHPDEVWLRYSYSEDEPWSKVSIRKGRKKLPPSHTFSLPEKYPNGHPIKARKLDDLRRMIPFLLPQYRQYYVDLCNNAPHSSSMDSDHDEE